MTKATYIDGFVLVVSKKNTAKYIKLAKEAARVWKKFGALGYMECRIDDKPTWVVMTFDKMVKPKKDEVVWYSFITYKSRKHRADVNKRVMAYFSKKYGDKMMKDTPFDMKRMAAAGFKVEASS